MVKMILTKSINFLTIAEKVIFKIPVTFYIKITKITFTRSKTPIEALEKSVKYVQS